MTRHMTPTMKLHLFYHELKVLFSRNHSLKYQEKKHFCEENSDFGIGSHSEGSEV